jgi:hypothetical protein
MKDRITIEGRDGAFGAYIARPKTLPASAVVVLHEVFGVNADIRKTCDELAEQGFLRKPRTFRVYWEARHIQKKRRSGIRSVAFIEFVSCVL